MAFEVAAVTVTTAATLLATGGGGNTARTIITVKPAVLDTGDGVFIGPSTVTAATGLPLGGGMSYDVQAGEPLFAITASGTVAVRVLEHGV